ncbi:flavin reductase family protein [Streptomyces sp. NPDC101776]|uniref:flavin reductase family protein n=1 Tax=Streptomyces sp. NPDC101776 TaxID=3366146 RepID=UPI003801F7A5
MPAASPDQTLAPHSDAAFLDAMSALAGGVCVVTTTTPDGRPAGFTSTAVMSLSRDPRLLAIGVGRHSRTLPFLLESGRFALNVLHAGGEDVSRRFADSGADRFGDLDWEQADDLPLLGGHSSHMMVCRVEQDVPAGDHRLIIGLVEKVLPGLGHGAGSLVYLGRDYHPLRHPAEFGAGS